MDGRADMKERLRPRDLAFLATDSPTTPMHNATLEVFEGGSGFDHARALALVEDRIARSWELAAPARLLEAGGR